MKGCPKCGKRFFGEKRLQIHMFKKHPDEKAGYDTEVCGSYCRGWYVQASMELGPEDVSLLERCPHFRGWYVQASMELGPEDVSLLERCPH